MASPFEITTAEQVDEVASAYIQAILGAQGVQLNRAANVYTLRNQGKGAKIDSFTLTISQLPNETQTMMGRYVDSSGNAVPSTQGIDYSVIVSTRQHIPARQEAKLALMYRLEPHIRSAMGQAFMPAESGALNCQVDWVSSSAPFQDSDDWLDQDIEFQVRAAEERVR